MNLPEMRLKEEENEGGERVILQATIRRGRLTEKKTAHLRDWAGTLLKPAVGLLQRNGKLRAVLHLDEIALG